MAKRLRLHLTHLNGEAPFVAAMVVTAISAPLGENHPAATRALIMTLVADCSCPTARSPNALPRITRDGAMVPSTGAGKEEILKWRSESSPGNFRSAFPR